MIYKSKGATKLLLADSLKKLMLKDVSFEKITIRAITSQVGLIRPTFYNHFQDKYELLEWIFYNDIIEPTYILLDTQMIYEAIQLILIRIENEKDFFQIAYKVKGQNSFQNMVFNGLHEWFRHLIEKCGSKTPELHSNWLTPENISSYYANSMVFIIQMWIIKGFPASAEEMMHICKYLITHTLEDFISEL